MDKVQGFIDHMGLPVSQCGNLAAHQAHAEVHVCQGRDPDAELMKTAETRYLPEVMAWRTGVYYDQSIYCAEGACDEAFGRESTMIEAGYTTGSMYAGVLAHMKAHHGFEEPL